MAGEQKIYAGDAALAGLLEAAGARYSVAEVRAVAAGVIAAPPGADVTRWTGLVVADAGEALKSELVALAHQMQGAADYGLGQSPAPPERLDALRAELGKRGADGFLVPTADAHQNEFPPPQARRLAWLTGFQGSAGLALVLPETAAIFVDGRYTLQVREQVDPARFTPQHLTEQPPSQWIADKLATGVRLGYDPWLHTAAGVERYRGACRRAGAELVALDSNPVDAVWHDQPPLPVAPVVPHEGRYAGRDSREKRQEIASVLKDAGAHAAVLSAPDSIAWLLNIRGGDIPHAPLALAFAIVAADGSVALFIDQRKLTGRARAHLGSAVTVHEPPALGAALDALGKAGRRVLAAPRAAPSWLFDRLEAAGAEVVRGEDPCALPKACKNSVELQGARTAHVRDGAALVRFLAWLAEAAPGGDVDELTAAAKLDGIRAGGELFQGLSFDTISGAGANGAIVHYHAGPETNRRLAPGMLYLVDSGAQYLDGTTDVTRTVAIGLPDADMRDRFTRVLKGHIAVATARFPAGTTGAQLDSLARTALWQAGLDFDHGTGHGVGSYLNVHEGPQRIAKRAGDVALRPGMVVSNEPGYYKAGAWGIRIENLLAVRAAAAIEGAEGESLEFETLTLAPIDRALVDPALMTVEEIAWLDTYHERVKTVLTPQVDENTAAWLKSATAALGG